MASMLPPIRQSAAQPVTDELAGIDPAELLELALMQQAEADPTITPLSQSIAMLGRPNDPYSGAYAHDKDGNKFYDAGGINYKTGEQSTYGRASRMLPRVSGSGQPGGGEITPYQMAQIAQRQQALELDKQRTAGKMLPPVGDPYSDPVDGFNETTPGILAGYQPNADYEWAPVTDPSRMMDIDVMNANGTPFDANPKDDPLLDQLMSTQYERRLTPGAAAQQERRNGMTLEEYEQRKLIDEQSWLRKEAAKNAAGGGNPVTGSSNSVDDLLGDVDGGNVLPTAGLGLTLGNMLQKIMGGLTAPGVNDAPPQIGTQPVMPDTGGGMLPAEPQPTPAPPADPNSWVAEYSRRHGVSPAVAQAMYQKTRTAR